MATYVIGDLQGCLDPLQRLLDRCRFDPAADHVVFTGDLVARGPDSLGCLRFARELGGAATTVLGNHDLHLLALAHGHGKPGDGLDAVLAAPDTGELIDFLRHQSMAWQSAERGALVVHAGLAPQWTLDTALALAREVESLLRDTAALAAFLPRMYGNTPDRWDPALTGDARLRFAINCFTRARFCTIDGRFDLSQKGAPGSQSPELLPWFAVPDRATRGTRVLFGHWSALGRIEWPEWNVRGLDTGCVWGGPLTALRLEDDRLIQVPASPR